TIQCRSRIALAELYLQREEWGRAVELCEQCAALLVGSENRVMQMELGAPMAEAYCGHGRLDEATRIIADTLAPAQATGARHYESLAWRVEGQIYATQGMAGEAARTFGQAIALCEALGSRLELARTLYQRGQLHHKHAELDAAQADWALVRTLCAQM